MIMNRGSDLIIDDNLDIVKFPNLGEKSHVCFCVLIVTELDSLGPVVTPFHHGTWL